PAAREVTPDGLSRNHKTGFFLSALHLRRSGMIAPGSLLMDDSPIPDPPAALDGLDALTVGRSLLGVNMAPPPPVVAGFTDPVFLAQGGLGQVWSARREADGLPVALKIPHRTGPEPAERLVLEAEALRHLDHPHIVRLLDLTEDAGGAPVLVMELVDGPAL